jgi:glyoxylase-like metal-dependent hydrolase (beta-lactamase superfamily II)
MALTRRDFLATTAGVLGAGALGQPTIAGAWQRGRGRGQAPQWTPVFTEIRRGVGYFTGRGGTIGYLVDPGGVVAIDSQFPDSAPVFVAGLKERSQDRPVDRLFNTHHHGDHSGGNNAFRGVAKRVVAHERAAALIKAAAEQPNAAEQLVPDTTFTDVWREEIGGEWVRAKHYGRAHTGGDAVITCERANVAHMGDLMFNRRIPVIDRVNGAHVANWVTVLEKTVGDHSDDTVYIFGHAAANQPVTGSRRELLYFRDYLTALLDHTRAAIKAGQTREQYTASNAIVPAFEGFGPHRANTLGILFDEIADGVK